MAKKITGFKTKGMNQDLSVSAFTPKFAFENRNLRLSTNEFNTQLSWVNEKGTKLLGTSSPLYGVPIGTAVLDKYLIVFTHEPNITGTPNPNLDHIYRLEYNEGRTSFITESLYGGYLGFSTSHPLETLVSYESEHVQKVYWTDGKNQPRLIDITDTYTATPNRSHSNPDFIFDFVPELSLNETVKVEKLLGANGMFAPGVIQYAFTYYHKYGQESNIFYTSPLLYISHKDRGASPEDKVENAFRITINTPDTNFDFLRIYSIQRTSINATPICKRVQDISLSGLTGNKVCYIDTGTSGDSIDPTELLYKGGESITAETLEQKNNTLFFGNIKVSRVFDSTLRNEVANNITLTNDIRSFTPMKVSEGTYAYSNQLTSKGIEKTRHDGMTVPCGGFKTGDYYRCGVQLQYKTGKWSDPIYISKGGSYGDFHITRIFSEDVSGVINAPIIKGTLNPMTAGQLLAAGYRKIRPVVVFPDPLDRVTVCQGVVAPTVFTNQHRDTDKDKDTYAQSSWFFRPAYSGSQSGTTTFIPNWDGVLPYTSNQVTNDVPTSRVTPYDPSNIRQVEIQGQFNGNNKFQVDRAFRTLHSPEIEFDEKVSLMSLSNLSCYQVGTVEFTHTMSDIDIQTETPTVSSLGSGFIHKPFSSDGAAGIISGLFYEDCLVDDNIDKGDDDFGGIIAAFPTMRVPAKFLVYPWQGSGSLNNDINRPANRGTASAILKKKVISNLRYATTNLNMNTPCRLAKKPQVFSGDEVTILKFEENAIYKGNVDTMLTPDSFDGTYFLFGGWNGGEFDGKGEAGNNDWCKTFHNQIPGATEGHDVYCGVRKWHGDYYTSEEPWKFWNLGDGAIGEEFRDLVVKKLNVRMKYKSTPHIALGFMERLGNINEEINQLAIVELRRGSEVSPRFGGISADALRENTWVPCGEPVSLSSNGNIDFYYDYGDTYFQRYDCLKTYPFTREDPNQIVEIGSFMLETHVNIDGRYDRNRGQMNNLNMSPTNFNLMNPVYSQIDNFFSYKIQDDNYYKDTSFPNQITWSKTKTSGADVDLWTNMTLASMLEFDGDKGPINKLLRFNDQLLAFQDTGISQVLYDENVQVSSTAGVPIEIANSGKVQGKRYITSTIGCSNKWSIVPTPSGIYFMDSHDKSIFSFSDKLVNISQMAGFNSWAKKNIPAPENIWNPVEFGNFVTYYDKLNQDVMFINNSVSLHYSEKFTGFTSFYDYGNTPYFNNFGNTGVWLKQSFNEDTKRYYTNVWQHNTGTYCSFFGAQKPYWMTLIGNPEAQLDKTFTNLEFRASVDGDGTISGDRFTPLLPFDSLETWNEFQHGIAALQNKNGHAAMEHHTSDGTEALKRKFRIWRCDIPRDNYAAPENNTELNIYRKQRHPMDRMRNMWLYLKLLKGGNTSSRVEVHDMLMTYFV